MTTLALCDVILSMMDGPVTAPDAIMISHHVRRDGELVGRMELHTDDPAHPFNVLNGMGFQLNASDRIKVVQSYAAAQTAHAAAQVTSDCPSDAPPDSLSPMDIHALIHGHRPPCLTALEHYERARELLRRVAYVHFRRDPSQLRGPQLAFLHTLFNQHWPTAAHENKVPGADQPGGRFQLTEVYALVHGHCPAGIHTSDEYQIIRERARQLSRQHFQTDPAQLTTEQMQQLTTILNACFPETPKQAAATLTNKTRFTPADVAALVAGDCPEGVHTTEALRDIKAQLVQLAHKVLRKRPHELTPDEQAQLAELMYYRPPAPAADEQECA